MGACHQRRVVVVGRRAAASSNAARTTTRVRANRMARAVRGASRSSASKWKILEEFCEGRAGNRHSRHRRLQSRRQHRRRLLRRQPEARHSAGMLLRPFLRPAMKRPQSHDHHRRAYARVVYSKERRCPGVEYRGNEIDYVAKARCEVDSEFGRGRTRHNCSNYPALATARASA